MFLGGGWLLLRRGRGASPLPPLLAPGAGGQAPGEVNDELGEQLRLLEVGHVAAGGDGADLGVREPRATRESGSELLGRRRLQDPDRQL